MRPAFIPPREISPVSIRRFPAPAPRGRDDRRRQLVAGLAGRVVEIGCGSGLCFGAYPPAVSSVLAVEPDPARAGEACRAARAARVPVTVRVGVAEQLPLASGTADAAVASLVLCSVPDLDAALAELRRVLRPHGELRFYEHVLASRGPRRALQRLVGPAYRRLPEGCHIARDTEAAIASAGFAIERVERFLYSPSRLEPAMPHVIGRAYA